MLLEFRVRNYKSIRDDCIFSMVASADKQHANTHLINTGIKALPNILRTAVIYGANASGKSTLVNAITFARALVAESSTSMQLGQPLNTQPFRLDNKNNNEPSEFEFTYIDNGVRYQYGFSLNSKQIIEEWLLVYRNAKPQQWFRRRYDVEINKDVYEFSSYLSGPRKLWQESTRPNALFLSTAVQLNSEQLSPVFGWIVNKLLPIGAGVTPLPDITTGMLQDPDSKREVQDFLTSADISITDIRLEPRKGFIQTWNFDIATGKSNISNEEKEMFSPQFMHVTENGSAVFELHEESMGTQRLYAFAGPVLDILKQGKILIVDELDSSLHTLLVRRLVDMFNDPVLNKNSAQLIFTTHDTALLDIEILRRDQVWFVEKNSDQASTLYPLSDFSPRKNEALERGYLVGRYGAVPFFSDFKI